MTCHYQQDLSSIVSEFCYSKCQGLFLNVIAFILDYLRIEARTKW